MTGDSSEIKYPKSSLLKSSIKIPKYLYFVLMILVLGILIVIEINFLLNNKNKTSEETAKPKEIIRLDVAKISVNWLDTQRNDKGVYAFSCKCDNSECKTCTKSNDSQREGAFMVWGRYKYFEKSKDQGQLKKIQEELSTLTTLPLQFEDWNCRILLDLWNSTILDSKTKELVADVCQNDGRVGTLDFGSLDPEKDKKVLGDMLKNIERIINKQSLEIDSVYDKNLLKNEFEQNVFFTSEDIAKNFVLAQRIDNVKVLKSNPEQWFKFALYGYDLLNELPNMYHNSILGIAALDMYKSTNEKIYLDLAQFMEEQNKLIDTDYKNNNALIYRGLLVQNLNGFKSDKKYLDISENLVATIIDNMFDYDDFNNYRGGLGGFREANKDFFEAKQNGLIIGLISNDL